MILGEVEREAGDGVQRLVAEVRWEEWDRPPSTVFLEAAEDSPCTLRPTAAAFLPALAAAAHVHGERRLAVHDPVDPVLLAGLDDATAAFRNWDGSTRPAFGIEAPVEATSPPPAPGLTALLLTGGVDSTAALVDNHRRYAATHPRRVGSGIVVYGLDDSTEGDPLAPDGFLVALAAHFGVPLLAVRTNLRRVEPSLHFWRNHGQTATWSSVAHGLGGGVRDLLVGSDDRIGDPPLRGADPVLDDAYSSTYLRVHHAVMRFTRLERLQLVATSGVGLEQLQVCNQPRTTWAPLNCGTCEKCIRTMLGLASIGALDRATGFPTSTLTPAAVAGTRITDAPLRGVYRELLPGLVAVGRTDLADATLTMLRRSWPQDVRKVVGGWDDRLLAGNARRVWQRRRTRLAPTA